MAGMADEPQKLDYLPRDPRPSPWIRVAVWLLIGLGLGAVGLYAAMYFYAMRHVTNL